MSILALVIVPRVSAFLGGGRGNLNVFLSIISRTYDNAFLRKENCFLAVHCDKPSMKKNSGPLLDRENGLSVLISGSDGNLAESKSRVLGHIAFSGSFHIEEVILSNGETIREGTALIPFYSEGYSDDAIIHILIGNDRYSVVIYKMRKEPHLLSDYISFEEVRSGNAI
jgi:hypothetical protein